MGASDVSILPQRTVIFPTTVFQAGAATDVPLIVKGTTGQTGNLMEFYNGAGTLVNFISAAGLLGGSASDDTNALIWTE